MKVKIILNPYANRWGAKALIPAVQNAFTSAGLPFDLAVTGRPGQAIEEARMAGTGGYDAVVAAGGDGTVNEVVNGLIAASGDEPTLPLGVLPAGTGNDFNDMAGLPREMAAAVQIIARGKTRQLDAGRVIAHNSPLVDRYFDNNCALAMEPMVTLENIRMTRLSGNIRYVAALARALLKLKAWQMQISWDGGGYEGPAYLLSVCNSPRTGGLFLMAPGALMDDGLFDFIFAPEMPKRDVLAILPRLFKGTHIQHPKVTAGRTAHLTIHSNPGTPIHADGELIAEAATMVEYQILPGKITLLS
ncbi:MAG: diacylglycerol kinase family protein [Chloroflexota bacterium]